MNYKKKASVISAIGSLSLYCFNEDIQLENAGQASVALHECGGNHSTD